jgi:peroxiredoxin
MSLKEQLEAHTRTTRHQLPAELREANEALLAQLELSGMLESICAAGDPMPNFELADADGSLLSSRELLERGPIVVSFFRGDWCPYCRLELKSLEAALGDIEHEGARLVAVTPDTNTALASVKRSNNLSFHVLSDPDHGVALLFGVAYRVPDDLRAQYLRHGVDLAARHGNNLWFLPIPATFIVDRRGIIRHAQVDADPRQRMEPADIIQVLRGLRG